MELADGFLVLFLKYLYHFTSYLHLEWDNIGFDDLDDLPVFVHQQLHNLSVGVVGK